ncbi:hypothetical protein F5879DRAFT_943302 [Lentinula edodes]|nr:hypothetical protein F5879DRAFT_943302 [Lentinula edodes]
MSTRGHSHWPKLRFAFLLVAIDGTVYTRRQFDRSMSSDAIQNRQTIPGLGKRGNEKEGIFSPCREAFDSGQQFRSPGCQLLNRFCTLSHLYPNFMDRYLHGIHQTFSAMYILICGCVKMADGRCSRV